jgi:hypothetical protein
LPDKHSPERQKRRLLALEAALGSAPRALRRDACSGTSKASAAASTRRSWSRGLPVLSRLRQRLAWTYAKRALKFAKVCNDRDEGGGFSMHRLPTKAEAETIRRYCGIPKRREVGEPSTAQLSAGTAARAKLMAAPPGPPASVGRTQSGPAQPHCRRQVSRQLAAKRLTA